MNIGKIVTLCGLAAVLAASLAARGTPQKPAAAIPAEIAAQVKATDYAAVRIKKFPIAVEGWTYRRYTFFETVDKLKTLGITLLQAYPGQPLGNGDPKAVFGEGMPEADFEAAQAKLRGAGVTVFAYGVVDLGTTEPSMRKVFDFARRTGIRVVVCEPRDEAFPVLERLLEEYDLRAAIHNHPQPAKYALPLTVLERLKGLSARIGVCADTGHWMREGLNPVECLRLLRGRVLDMHLKDRTDFGKGAAAKDVAWGSGRAGLRDILAELTLQDYAGALTMEYENEEEVLTPEPAIRRSVAFVKSVTYDKEP